jgi:ABC-type transport system substrate-binding protein
MIGAKQTVIGRPRAAAAVVWLAVLLLVLLVKDEAAVRQEDIPKSGGLLRIQGNPQLYQPRLDPAQSDWIFVIQHIYDGLVRMDSSLNVWPELAEYWTVSDGGKTFTFFLRRGVRFHNGREFTAADAKFSLERILRPETHSPYAQYFLSKVVGAEDFFAGRAPEVAGFQALSRYIFEIRWRNPSLSALSLLSMSFARILPKEQVLAQGRDFFFKPAGTGAFKFSYWMRSPKLEIVGVRLDRNEAYFGRKPHLEAIEYSPHFTLDQFRTREVDVMPYLWEGLARTGCQVLEGGPLNTTFLMMSCTIPPFDRARVRRAIALAVDKERLAQAVASSATIRRVTNNFIPAKLPGFFPFESSQEPDPEQARRILEEDGFFTEKTFPEILFFVEYPRQESEAQLYRELKRQLEAVGLILDLQSYRNLEELRGVRRPYLVPIVWQMDFPDPENIVQQLFAGPTVLNRIVNGYANADLAALIDSVETEQSRTRRLELFREMQKILSRDVPAIPLYSNEQRLAVQPYVRGVRVPTMGLLYLDAREIWIDRKEP